MAKSKRKKMLSLNCTASMILIITIGLMILLQSYQAGYMFLVHSVYHPNHLKKSSSLFFEATNMTKPTILVGVFVAEFITPLETIEAFRTNFRLFSSSDAFRCEIHHVFFVGVPEVDQEPTERILGPDVLRGNFTENMNEGKTLEWLRAASAWFRRRPGPPHPASMAFKMDADAVVNWTRLDAAIAALRPGPSYFYGRVMARAACGDFPHCPPANCSADFRGPCWVYMQGGFYGLSESAVHRLAACGHAADTAHGIEDLMVGLWLKGCGTEVALVDVPHGDVFCHSSHTRPTHIAAGEFPPCDKR